VAAFFMMLLSGLGDEAFEGNPGRARVMESASPHMIRHTKHVVAFRK